MRVPCCRALSFFALTVGVLLPTPAAFGQNPFFITSYTQSIPRNNYTGFVGMQFTVGSLPLYVTQLGRAFESNNGTVFFSQTHLVKLVNAQTGVDVPNGAATIAPNASGGNGFLYAPLPATVLLAANTSYLLLSQETAGGDYWYDYTPVNTSGFGTVNAAVYEDAGGNYIRVPNSAGYSYVPANLWYSTEAPGPTVNITSPVSGSTFTGSTIITYSASVATTPGFTIASVQFELGDSSGQNLTNYGPALTQAPYTLTESASSLTLGVHTLVVKATDSAGNVTAASAQFTVAATGGSLLTGFSGTVVRNNYSGFVGLEFTVGGSPLIVTSLGRVALPGNNGTHTLKLVNAQTSQDVSGGTVSITMIPGTGTTFQYAPLASPLTLSANTTYLLLSKETSGGDTWYDYSPVTGVAGGTSINGAVYSNASGAYVLVPNSQNYSYVPVNLTTSVSGTGTVPGTISITSPANNSIFANGAITFSANYTPTTGNTATSVQFVLNNSNFGSPITSPPYTVQVDSSLLGGSTDTLTAVGLDSGGNVATSSTVNFTVALDNLPFLQETQETQAFQSATNIGMLSGQYFGMEFTVGSTPLRVTQLGFYYCCTLADRTEGLKLVDAATGLDIPGSFVLATLPGFAVGGFAFSAFGGGPITLQANKSYYLLSQQTSDSVSFLLGPAVSTGLGTVNYPVYQAANNTYQVATNMPGYSYAPVNFQYQSTTPIPPVVAITAPAANSALSGTVPVTFSYSASYPLTVATIQSQLDGANVGSPVVPNTLGMPVGFTLDTTAFSNGVHVLTAIATDSNGTQATSSGVTVTFSNTTHTTSASPAFVTSFSPTFLRNNYSGFVGFNFTVGAVPLQISSLGRICVNGNTGAHIVKLVQAYNGSDVSGGSVSVSLSGCTAGQFVYSALTSPITLPAATTYYLMDQETLGGDQWYDFSPVTTASAATVNGPVYSTGSQFVTVGAPGSSYVPLNFLFTAEPAVTNPGFGVTLATTQNSTPITATVSSMLPVASVQFQVDSYNFGAALTTAPYVMPTVPALNFGTHAIVAVAHDSSGNTAASAPTLLSVFNTGFVPVIGFTGTTLRNNFSGWVGLRLTTGNSPYLISSLVYPNAAGLGRFCSAGNSMVHLVKLVNASDGTDVPNAIGWINMAGCSPGAFIQASLPYANVVLAANTSYYLVSQEVIGGDSWYDVSPAMPLASVSSPVPPILGVQGFYAPPASANFTIDGPVYSAANGSLVFVPLPNYSFVGLSVAGFSPVICRGLGYYCGP